MFVDHSAEKRGGHLGHAMVEYADGCLLCFYADCRCDILDGHTGVGWMNMKRSIDGGKTWSKPKKLCPVGGWVYDVRQKNNRVFVLFEAGRNGEANDVRFQICRSEDYGRTFSKYSVLPFSAAEKLHQCVPLVGRLSRKLMT